MASRLSRRKIASYYADQLLAGHTEVARQLAAYLVDSRRTRELELIVRDIEDALAARGVMIAEVSSAHELEPATKTAITQFITATSDSQAVHLRSNVDPSLLGGVKINLPGQELDATLRRKLTLLKSNKR